MFTLRFTTAASEQLKVLTAAADAARRNKKPGDESPKQVGLLKQVGKTLKYLEDNPRHPSLQTHKYDGIDPPPGVSDIFEAYAQNQTSGAYRIFWGYGPVKGEITVVAITPHP